ncbi:hypothetical protein TNCV_1878681 [Trichonephila clavipes]|nr:hypothetical protein TNCV_1878681 [Trichonephila clavipes]
MDFDIKCECVPGTVRKKTAGLGYVAVKHAPNPCAEFQRKRRLTWVREHSLWTIKDWRKVLFSDESQFCISGGESAYLCKTRRTHEEFSP